MSEERPRNTWATGERITGSVWMCPCRAHQARARYAPVELVNEARERAERAEAELARLRGDS